MAMCRAVAAVALAVAALLAAAVMAPVEAAPATQADLVLRCTRSLDFEAFSSDKLDELITKFSNALTDDCGLSADGIVADLNAISPISANILTVPLVDQAALESIASCIDTSELRFRRCTAQAVYPHDFCEGETYPTTATFTMADIRRLITRRLNMLSEKRLNVFAAQLLEAVQEQCGLSECDVKAVSAEDITPLSQDSFSVQVKSPAVVTALQECEDLSFFRLRVENVV